MDQCMGSYTTNSKNKKWSHTGLSLIMDTTRVNGKTLTSLNKGLDPTKVDSFEWGMELCTDLVTPHIRKRLSNVDNMIFVSQLFIATVTFHFLVVTSGTIFHIAFR